MNTPKRIQRQRTKGWRMPENTVYVGRPTQWGNEILPSTLDLNGVPFGRERAVEVYRIACEMADCEENREHWAGWLAPLRGKNLACWCKVGDACHADVLLELANRPEAGER